MIKTYTNESSWNSESKSTTESTVGLLLDTNTSVVNGVNVVVKYPKYGDAVVEDANGNVVYIAGETFVNSSFPSGWKKWGVVYNVCGKEVWVVSYTGGSYKFAAVRIWTASGFNLDGATHTFTLTTDRGSSTSTAISYYATSLSSLCTQLNTTLANNDPSGYQWSCYLKDGKVIFQANVYDSWRQDSYTSCSGGVTLTTDLANDIPEINYSQTNCGEHILYAVVNNNAVKRWGGTTPSSNVSVSWSQLPVSQSAFNTSSYCSSLKDRFGTYDNYLGGISSRIPSNKGVSSWINKGKEFTYALKDKTYIDKSGNTKKLFTAVDYAASYGSSTCDLLKAGNWYIPDVEELVTLMRPITVGNSGINSTSQYDRVNQTISKMGGRNISTYENRWSSCRCYSDCMWDFHRYGVLGHDIFCHSFIVSPVCRLLIS